MGMYVNILAVIEPQRYNFLSKSQLRFVHILKYLVVIEPQRYNFLSKSQHKLTANEGNFGCY